MKAIRVNQYGGPEVLRYEDCPEPVASPGKVVVDVQAVGVNFADIYSRTGLYPSKTPFTPGIEAAGVVSAVGDGVKGIRVGDAVGCVSVPGMYAEKVAVPVERVVSLPQGIDAKTAAAALLQGMTAHYLVHDTYPLKRGDRALVHAGAGGVGLLLVQMAKMRGAYVYATVSTDEKAALARKAGADKVIIYTREDFAAETNADTRGEGVQVVYDSVGKDTFEKSLSCLARRGCLALYGQSSGPVSPIAPFVLYQRSRFLTRPSLADYTPDRASLLRRTRAVLGWVASGKLSVRVYKTYPLAQASAAHRDLESRQTVGKLLLVP